MRLVIDQSGEDIRRLNTRRALVWPLRKLTANLLRIANGAGSPLELMKQLRDCHEALRQYAEAHTNALPSDYEIQEILDCDRAWREIRPGPLETQPEVPKPKDHDFWIEREMALRLIRKGVLQIVASRLLHHIPLQGEGRG